jgi:hypothetical protein
VEPALTASIAGLRTLGVGLNVRSPIFSFWRVCDGGNRMAMHLLKRETFNMLMRLRPKQVTASYDVAARTLCSRTDSMKDRNAIVNAKG